MRTDPRKMCSNEHEVLLWAVVHDLIAHPLMALSGYAGWAVRFHDKTSRKAWPIRPASLKDLPAYPDAGLGPQLRGYDETFSIDDALRAEGAVRHA